MSQEGLRGHPTGSSNHISRFDPVMIPSDGTAEGTSNAPPANPTHHLQAQFPDLPTSVNVQRPVGYSLTKWQLGGCIFPEGVNAHRVPESRHILLFCGSRPATLNCGLS